MEFLDHEGDGWAVVCRACAIKENPAVVKCRDLLLFGRGGKNDAESKASYEALLSAKGSNTSARYLTGNECATCR
jgi:hypothetical protein